MISRTTILILAGLLIGWAAGNLHPDKIFMLLLGLLGIIAFICLDMTAENRDKAAGSLRAASQLTPSEGTSAAVQRDSGWGGPSAGLPRR